jgi:hypothetical protein
MPGLLHKVVTGFQSERTLLKVQAFRAGRQPLYKYSASGQVGLGRLSLPLFVGAREQYQSQCKQRKNCSDNFHKGTP